MLLRNEFDAKNIIFSQLHSVAEHFIKVSIGCDLYSAEKGNDWEKQINSFFDRISRVILTSTNKPPKYDFYVPIIESVIKDWKETGAIVQNVVLKLRE